MPEVHLSAAQAERVRGILQVHLPGGTRVSVFGSRATGRGLKPHSDLVDLLDRRDAGDEFLARLARQGLVEWLCVQAGQG